MEANTAPCLYLPLQEDVYALASGYRSASKEKEVPHCKAAPLHRRIAWGPKRLLYLENIQLLFFLEFFYISLMRPSN